jgi:hypothetical protein
MAIPTGTKFHGVAPEVSTKNLGSAQVNAMRDVYTIEEIRTSAGTIVYTKLGCNSITRIHTLLFAGFFIRELATMITAYNMVRHADWLGGRSVHMF